MHGTDRNKIYIHKPFIYMTREVFVRHTFLCNLKTLEDTRDQKLTHSDSSSCCAKIDRERQTKEATNGFSGSNNMMTTDSWAVTRPAKGEAAVSHWMVGRYFPCVGKYMASKLY